VFSGCKNLETAYLSEGVTSLGVNTFAECPNFKTVTIPRSVTHFGLAAFAQSPAVVIHGYSGSPSQDYANANGILFVDVEASQLLPGDANSDGKVNIEDLESIINYFVSKTPCKSMDNADANGDKAVDVQDILWIIDKMIGG
jgi:hypothetical protein